jgi:hypothetical protein
MVGATAAEEIRPVERVLRFEMSIKVSLRFRRSGVSADEVAEQVRSVRDEIGRQMMARSIEAVQEALLQEERLPRVAARHNVGRRRSGESCTCSRFTRQGYHQTRRLRTPLGEVAFRVGRVKCARCGTKHTPILRWLGIERRQRRLAGLEKIIAEIVSVESYGETERLVKQVVGERIADATIHDWIADIDWDELRLGRYARPAAILEDGTAFKKRKGERGEVRAFVGVDARGRLFPLGVFSGLGLADVATEIKKRLAGHSQANLFMHDGEKDISKHLADIAEREGRCRWHMPRGLRYALWQDGLGKSQSDPHVHKLAGIVGVEIPDEDWQELSDGDVKPLRDELKRARDEYQTLVNEFRQRGYSKAHEYLSRAARHLFAEVEIWLDTGLVLPGTISSLERLFRQIGRRIKAFAYNWTDEGVARISKILLKKKREPADWDRYWHERQRLQGRCRVRLLEVAVERLPNVG